MQSTISPIAKRVITKCGGVDAVISITGRSKAQIYKWTWSRPVGTGGLIPASAQQLLMAAAHRGEVNLSPEDFFETPEATTSNADR